MAVPARFDCELARKCGCALRLLAPVRLSDGLKQKVGDGRHGRGVLPGDETVVAGTVRLKAGRPHEQRAFVAQRAFEKFGHRVYEADRVLFARDQIERNRRGPNGSGEPNLLHKAASACSIHRRMSRKAAHRVVRPVDVGTSRCAGEQRGVADAVDALEPDVDEQAVTALQRLPIVV